MSLHTIIDSLVNQKIDYSQAYDQIKSLPKPWHRAEWKVLRDKLIKDQCEKCSTKQGPMVIQHTEHPTAFATLKAEAMQKFAGERPEIQKVVTDLIEQKGYQALSKVIMLSQFNDVRFNSYVNAILDNLDIDVTDIVNSAGIERDCCPECSRLVTDRHYRKTWQKYKCEAGHIFEDLSKVIWYKKYRTKDKLEATRAAKLSILRESKAQLDQKIFALKKRIDNMVGREALLLAFEEHTLYMSMKYTKTYCKSCAYQEDLEKGRIK